MPDLQYSLIIEATDDSRQWRFYSPELEGFSGIGKSIEDCLHKAKPAMEKHLAALKKNSLPIPPPNARSTITLNSAPGSKKIPNEILIAEFEYLANAAQQANEDRARVTQYYLMTLGSVVASVLGLKEIKISDEYLPWVFSGLAILFFMLTSFGHLTIRQLIGFRTSWLRYTLEMDIIKQYYINQWPALNLSSVMRLLIPGLPDAYKSGSVANQLAMATCLMSLLAFIVALVFVGLAFYEPMGLQIGIVSGSALGIVLSILQYRYYRRQLENSSVQKEITRIKQGSA
jgi:predicted RNase H-like HicB family nuclease